MISQAQIRELDRADPLAKYRELFHLPAGKIYLDGNSLGVMPKRVLTRTAEVVGREWADGLIGSWNHAGWMALPLRAGDLIAPLIGAKAGEVVVGDSTSVNLFKCLAAALKARPGRTVIVSERDNFPTDNYIAQGLAGLLGGYELRYASPDEDVRSMIDASVAVVTLTHVNYRSSVMHDMGAVTRAAHAAGALTVWDLSHSTGAVPIDVAKTDCDFAVGCTYKYLNGGPGAPSVVYVAPRLANAVRQPLSGWIGHRQPFAFGLDYEPGEGAKRFLSGTPHIISLAALAEALSVWDGVDIAAVREKSLRMTELFMDVIEQECAGHNLRIITPRSNWRGSHVSIGCDYGYPVMRALIDRGVIGDFRPPDLLRFGFTPLYVSYRDVYDAARVLKDILAREAWRDEKYATVLEVT
jgi:kynureninase